MKRESRRNAGTMATRTAIVLVVFVCVVVSLAAAFATTVRDRGVIPAASGTDGQLTIQPDSPESAGGVRLVVYMDYDCPYCRHFHFTTLPALRTEFPDVPVTYRHLPLPIHPQAYQEAVAGECAHIQGGDTAFWQYSDIMFRMTGQEGGFDLRRWDEVAFSIGLDAAEFARCREDGDGEARVQEDIREALRVGATRTPTIVVQSAEEEVLIAGDYPAQIWTALKHLLSKSETARQAPTQ